MEPAYSIFNAWGILACLKTGSSINNCIPKSTNCFGSLIEECIFSASGYVWERRRHTLNKDNVDRTIKHYQVEGGAGFIYYVLCELLWNLKPISHLMVSTYVIHLFCVPKFCALLRELEVRLIRSWFSCRDIWFILVFRFRIHRTLKFLNSINNVVGLTSIGFVSKISANISIAHGLKICSSRSWWQSRKTKSVC
jgi:hypothetical protein